MAVDRINGALSSLAIKAPVRATTTANITLSGLQTIDGIALAQDDRVLVKDQTDAKTNGIYIADTGTWDRAPDFDSSRDVVQGTLVLINSGTVNGGSTWQITTANPITIGTTSIAFAISNDIGTLPLPIASGGTGGTSAATARQALVVSHPDDEAVVVGSSDPTKKVRFEVDGLTTATTRVITVPDADTSIAIVKRKTADESLTNSTVLQDDDHLSFPIGANEEWVGDITTDIGDLLSTTGARMALTVPGGATMRFSLLYGNDAGTGNALTGSTTASGTPLLISEAAGGGTGVVLCHFWVLNGATPGNVTLQWALRTSTSTLTVKKGSHLVAHRVA